MNVSTKKITTIGMLCAAALVVNLLIYFPMVPAVSFLMYDPKDIILIIGGFLYGPAAAFLMSAITSVLEILFRGGNLLDVLMNMISTCSFACTAAWLYGRLRSRKGALAALSVGALTGVACMLLWNYIVTPIYYQMPREAVVRMLLPGFLPFNLLKNALNMGMVLFLYKPIVHIFRKTSLVEERGRQEGMSKGMLLAGVFLCLTVCFCVLSLHGVI